MPATSGVSPIHFARSGIRDIIGMATTRTMETTKDSFLLSPLMAPQVAIAADTPQIDTALASIMPISLSSFSFLASQKVKYQTVKTTTTAWSIPKAPAFRISPNRTDVPSRIRPILM